jgi:threonine synthase
MRQLAAQGLLVEPTAALSMAALDQVAPLVQPGQTVVVVASGSGLKDPAGLELAVGAGL